MDKTRQYQNAETFISESIHKVWEMWTDPKHIMNWNNTSEEWYTPKAENNVRNGGKLVLRMETKNGAEGFDYVCTYDEVIPKKLIIHTTVDDRKTFVIFIETEGGVKILESFEPEGKTDLTIQQRFCQSILDNFKAYVENS